MGDDRESQIPEGCPTMRVIAMPKDSNAAGDIFGGWIVSQIDLAGAIVAGERAGGRIATVAMEAIHLRKPAFIGDVVSFFAAIVKIGRTSITVHVDVYASRQTGSEYVASGDVVYVAIGEDRKPRPLGQE